MTILTKLHCVIVLSLLQNSITPTNHSPSVLQKETQDKPISRPYEESSPKENSASIITVCAGGALVLAVVAMVIPKAKKKRWNNKG